MKNLFVVCSLLFIVACKKDPVPIDPGVNGSNLEITSISPVSANPGDTITITGKNFYSDVYFMFGDKKVTVVSRTPNEVKVITPFSFNGKVDVKAYSILGSSNGQVFNYTKTFGEVNVQGTTYFVDTLAKYRVGPGSTYMSLNYINGDNPLRVHVLEIQNTNPYVTFKPVLGWDSVITRETISSMAIRKSKQGEQYFAGTNGDFYETVSTAWNGRPLFGTMIDGEIATTPILTEIRQQALFQNSKKLLIDQVSFNGTVTGAAINAPITAVNQARLTNMLILFNNFNGLGTRANRFGLELVVMPISGGWGFNRDVKVTVIDKKVNLVNAMIPPGGAVLSGHGTSQDLLNPVNVGDELTIRLNMTAPNTNMANITQMIGAHDFILKDGTVLDPDWAERHPRTGLGASADGNKIYFCVVDGRSSTSKGVTTKQLADIMKVSGASLAVNLDGGGSSQMYVANLGIRNVPSDGQERSVGNGLFAVSSAPEDNQITEIAADTYMVRIKVGQTFTPKFYGYNRYGTLINANLSGVTLSAPAILGTISGSTFTAGSVKYGTITATYNGNISTQIKVMVGD